MKNPYLLLASIALAALSGCTPSPEEVCAHADKIAQKGEGEPIANCTRRMQMKQDMKPKEYRKLAPCIMKAQTVEALNNCLSTHQAK